MRSEDQRRSVMGAGRGHVPHMPSVGEGTDSTEGMEHCQRGLVRYYNCIKIIL